MKISSPQQTARRGFNLIELLVVIAIIAVLASLLLPVLGAAKAKAHKAKCISNLKQLATASHLYMVDNADRLVANGFGVPENAAVNGGKTNAMWVMGDEHNYPTQYTNTDYLINENFSLFARYKISAEVYKCPADPSTREIGGAQVARVRNYSLNLFFGWDYPVNQYRVGKNNLLDPNYYQFHKDADLDQVNPSKLFTFIDTSPVSVCYPGFVVAMSTLAAWHRPSVEHQNYGVVAFADSHVESPHWMNKQTIELAHTPTATGPLPDPKWKTSTGAPDGDHVRFVTTGANQDIEWLRQHASTKK